MPVTLMIKGFVRELGSRQNVDKLHKNRRTAATRVRRYTDLAVAPSTPYRASTACRRRHYDAMELIGACGDCGLRRSKSAWEMPVEIALITGLLDGSGD